MKWQFEYQGMPCILVAQLDGVVDTPSANSMVREMLDLAAQRNCYRFLIDFTHTIVNMTLTDVMARPQAYQELGLPSTAPLVMLFANSQDKYRFWETVAQNSGFNFRVFFSRPEAVKWLTTQEPETI